MRTAGALLPVASLPSKYGIGDFGQEAYQFIDILAKMEFTIWQVLPLNPLGYGNSPYQAYSSFAGDEIYISLDKLVADELLSVSQISEFNSQAIEVEYQTVRDNKAKILQLAFENFTSGNKLQEEYLKFRNSTSWVKNYAVFLTFKKANQLRIWTAWSAEQKNWIKDQKLDLTPYQAQIDYELFIQFIFYRQWLELKAYANKHGISIMGDIPFYIGMDSLDVWENQEMFLLDSEQQPIYIAGVPPDFFSATGQRWGNPIYDWDALEKSEFKFWIDRLKGNCLAFDIIRIDHFRAFDTYWKIPSSCPTAMVGEWIEAPGYKLFDRVYAELPDINIIAEDLGDLRKEVLTLRDHYNLKGMHIFQFEFEPTKDNAELEEAVNTIIYPGTHDNSTLMGWYKELTSEKQEELLDYFVANNSTIKDAMLEYIMQLPAEYAIFAIQDILGLDDSARINTPGTLGSPNWEWKLKDFNALNGNISSIKNLVIASQRNCTMPQ